MIYHLIRELVRLAAYVFYRRIEVVGLENIPQEGATIFFGNHPNSLLDPALITAFGERKLHFMAKDTLFSKPLLSLLLAQMGAVPVRRRQDQAKGALNNEHAFTELYELLRSGGAMGIFPEGISHNGAQLSELKTGAARIAIEMYHQGVHVKLIPCGLTYLTRDRFRSSVLIQFGEAITLETAEQAQVSPRELTTQMELYLRSLTINAQTWDDLSLLDTVRRLYQPPKITIEERVELARRFNTYYPNIKDKEEIQALAHDLKNYQEELYLLGLKDKDISGSLNAATLFGRCLRHLMLTIVWLPLALLGSPIHFPIAFLLGHGSRIMAPRKDVVATTKFIAGFLMLNALYGALGIWSWSLGYGYLSIFVPLLFALSGFGCLKLAERGRALWGTLWIWTHCIAAKRTIKDLRARRRQLRAEVLATVNTYLPSDLERMFYGEPVDD
jgi:glycerol-3-phosphate O-acyltransferase / dihydroxyacetone phosphate acyltransferase